MDQVLAETNQGYINSGVPVRVARFCVELATINDTAPTLTFLNNFQTMKETVSNLRNSADAAHLFAYSFQSCGAAYIASIGAKLTISISRKNCALGVAMSRYSSGKNS